jgi:hypothetical protein
VAACFAETVIQLEGAGRVPRTKPAGKESAARPTENGCPIVAGRIQCCLTPGPG